MKGKLDAYVLWPLDKGVQNWIVDWSTASNFTLNIIGKSESIMHCGRWGYEK